MPSFERQVLFALKIMRRRLRDSFSNTQLSSGKVKAKSMVFPRPCQCSFVLETKAHFETTKLGRNRLINNVPEGDWREGRYFLGLAFFKCSKQKK